MRIDNLKKQLVGVHRIINFFGWDDLLATHVSAKIDNNSFLITPKNTSFEDITEDKLILVDSKGHELNGNQEKVFAQAVNIHLPVYENNEKIKCIIHTHSPHGVAISSSPYKFKFIDQQSLRFYDDISYHEYNGLALDDEGYHISNSLNGKRVLILLNHGLLTTGKSISETMYYHYYLEKCCELQTKMFSVISGMKDILPNISKKTKRQFDSIISPEYEFKVLCMRAMRDS